MISHKLRLCICIGFFSCCALQAQEGFWGGWLDRSDQAKADQPNWMTPLVTVTPRLEQEFRADLLVEQMATGNDLINYDGGKGLELIPWERVELLFNLPPYIEHNNPANLPADKNGLGDVYFLQKFRMISANKGHGDYILTLFLGESVPTGTWKNGARGGAITPTLAGGKGFGNFDVQSTFGYGIPTSELIKTGHVLAWNTTLQYHLCEVLWPELEVNSNFYEHGENDGKKQTFLTPGIVFGRFTVHGHLRMAVGAGFEIAATQFYTYNHATVITVRFPF
jgi:hypothetical protein